MGRIEVAFQKVDRGQFLPEDVRGQADWDVPLPIGFGQTNSQPTTVRQMLEWLDAKPGDKVLDLGYGSGWTTALLSAIVGPEGMVYAVEKLPELAQFGKVNVERCGAQNVHMVKAGKAMGLPRYAPYDRILVSASATDLPLELVAQLKKAGKMVIPVGEDILEITKLPSGQLNVDTHAGFLFVPLID